jgi:hypothetical protein
MAAIARGYEAIGIEPDKAIAAFAEANGARVRQGSFPEMVRPGETFDAIVFNDVFEHLLDLPGATANIWRCLKPSGVLVINLPLQTGTFYRLADALDRVGIHGPLRRMWQLGFPSPHRSYFSADQLSQFVARHGFRESGRHTIPSVTVKGLWKRLCYDPNQSRDCGRGHVACPRFFCTVPAVLASGYRRSDISPDQLDGRCKCRNDNLARVSVVSNRGVTRRSVSISKSAFGRGPRGRPKQTKSVPNHACNEHRGESGA